MATQTAYGMSRTVSMRYEEALARTKEALKAEGFGVLTEVDVRATLQEKLGAEFRKYVILGACNPPLAHQALQAELDIGLLLPCNVIVYEQNGGSVIAALDPEAAMELTNNTALKDIAREAKGRLQRVVESV